MGDEQQQVRELPRRRTEIRCRQQHRPDSVGIIMRERAPAFQIAVRPTTRLLASGPVPLAGRLPTG